jgi:hypothetical protein
MPAEGWVSKNVQKRSQVDEDYWIGLFDTQAGSTASISSVSK